MATLPKNRITRSVSPKSIFESAKNVLSSSVSFNQGDLLAFDTSAKVLKAISTTADSSNFLGIAKVTVSSGKLVGPYDGLATNSSAIADVPGPEYGSVAKMILKTGDAFNPGDKVYLVAADAQTVTSSDPGDGKHIGVFQDALVSSASAGQEGNVLLGARYALAGLTF